MTPAPSTAASSPSWLTCATDPLRTGTPAGYGRLRAITNCGWQRLSTPTCPGVRPPGHPTQVIHSSSRHPQGCHPERSSYGVEGSQRQIDIGPRKRTKLWLLLRSKIVALARALLRPLYLRCAHLGSFDSVRTSLRMRWSEAPARQASATVVEQVNRKSSPARRRLRHGGDNPTADLEDSPVVPRPIPH
jgi:hypothetical protein